MITERVILDEEPKSELLNQHFARYVFAGSYVSGKSVLDVACGSGYGSKYLKEAGASRVDGIDISDDALRYATKHFAAPQVAFAKGDAQNLQVSGPFGVIVSFETIEHLERPERFLSESVKLLADGGVFIVSTPIRMKGSIADKPRNPFHVQEWTVREFTELLGGYYPEIEVYAQYNFMKNPFPYSRTVKHLFTKLFFPDIFAKVNEFKVLPECSNYASFRMEPVYLVLVCRRK